jgi:putative DNA primase/helicase
MIPEAVRGWVKDVARRACIPVEYVAGAVLVALASLLGRNLAIRPKCKDDWTCVGNLWGALVAPPSLLKTAAVGEALRPLRRLAAEALEAFKAAKAEADAARVVALAKADDAKDQLKKKVKANAPELELLKLAAEAARPAAAEPPTLKRYIVNDATVEKLGELLKENPRGLLQHRDELSGWLRTMDRQGHESDRGFYLECWNGTEPYTYDRVERGTIIIPYTCLSVFGTIQPGPLAKYLREAVSGERVDGFMPRFQVLLFPDPPGAFTNVDEWPDTEEKNRAFDVFRRLDALDPAAIKAAEHDEEHGLHFLRFDADAQAFFDGWRTALENRLRNWSGSAALACQLGKYRGLMPSLALLFHVIEAPWPDPIPPVSLAAAEMAARWCDLLEAHARRVYQYATEGDTEAAETLGERLAASLPNPFACWQVAQKGWRNLGTVDEVRRAVGILEDRGWVKVVERPSGALGGRPAEEVWVNPSVRPQKPGGVPPTGAEKTETTPV